MAPHICATIPSIVFPWPWQVVHRAGLERALTTSHPWANPKVVQNNGLLLQSCHLRGCCVEEYDGGVCLDMTMAGTSPPPAMEDDTGKVGRTPSVCSQALKSGPWRVKAWFLRKMLTVHPAFTALTPLQPTNSPTKALIRRCYEWNLRSTCFWLGLTRVLFLRCHL